MDSSTTQFLCHLPDRTLDEDCRNFRSSPEFRPRSLKMEQSADVDDDQPGSDVIGRPEVVYRTSDSRDASVDCDEMVAFASTSPSGKENLKLPVDEAQFYAAGRYGSLERNGGPGDPRASPGGAGGSNPSDEVASPSSIYPDKEERVLEEMSGPYEGTPLTNGFLTGMDSGAGNSPPLGNSPNGARVLYAGQHVRHGAQYVEASDRRFRYTEDEQMEADEKGAVECDERMQRVEVVGRGDGLEAKTELDEEEEMRYDQDPVFPKGAEYVLKEDNVEEGRIDGETGVVVGGGSHLADITAPNGHTFQVKVTGSGGLGGYSVIYPVHNGQHLLPSEDVENFFTSLEKPVPLQETMAEPTTPGLTTPSAMDEASSLTLLEKASFNQQGLSIQGNYPSYLQQPQAPSQQQQQQQQQGVYYNYPYNMPSFPPQGYPGTFCDPTHSYGLSTAQSQTFKALHQTIPAGYQSLPVNDHRSSSLLSVLDGTSGLNITLGGQRTSSSAQLTVLPLKVPSTSSSLSISSASCANGTAHTESLTASTRYYSNGGSPERQGFFIDDKGAILPGSMTPLGSPDGGVYYGALPYDLGPSHDGLGGSGWETARLTASLLSYSSPDEMRINGTGESALYKWSDSDLYALHYARKGYRSKSIGRKVNAVLFVMSSSSTYSSSSSSSLSTGKFFKLCK